MNTSRKKRFMVVDCLGMTFGRLQVLGCVENIKGKAAWLCLCSCGSKTVAIGSQLRNGRTRSCGCLQRDVAKELFSRPRVHGRMRSGEYASWRGMIERCSNPKHISYRNYGGRGIAVCEKWKTFSGFFEDMGPRPVGKSVDRINVNGNYEAANCKWSTRKEQNCNKRPRIANDSELRADSLLKNVGATK